MAGKLEERVKEIIVEQLGVNAEQVTPEASFIDDLGADSLAYKTIGRSHDEEETFEYSRWKEKPKVDLHGLKLEEHNDEFMKM